MADAFHPDRRSAARHWLLIVLIVGTAIVDVHRLSYLARYLSGSIALVPAPISAIEGTATIDTVLPEAAAAGLRPGDTILSIAGRSYTGSAILAQEIQAAKPGDVLDVSVRAPAAEASRTVRVPLVAKKLAPTDRWFVLISIFLVLPIGCQIVGFWAVRSRTWDTQAWIALALCLSVSQILYLGDEYRDGTLLSDISLVYKEVFGTTFAVWLLLYARNFSPKLPLEARLGWLRWMVIVPVAFVSLRNIAVRLDDLHGAALDSPLPLVTQYASLAPQIWPRVTLAAIVLFFLAMAGKCLAPGLAPDALRRLRLFFIGAAASMLPTLTLVIAARSTGRVLDEFHPLLLLPALLSTLLFPLTIAYISVVHRAPEVREVVRRGLWRTTSREALTVVQLALIVAFAVLVFSANRPELTAFAQKAIVVLAILMIALQPSFVDWLRGWADRRFFKEAWRVDQALALVDDLLGGVCERAEFGARLERLLSEALAANHVTALVTHTDGLYLATNGKAADGAADDIAAEGAAERAAERVGPMFRLDGALARHLTRDPELRLVYFDQKDSWVHQLPRDEQERLRALHTQVLVPLVARDGLRGAITLGAKPYDRPYSDAELLLLSAVARHATLALRNAELLERVSAEAINRERLRGERDAAEKANTAKSAFLASMSHELRTPMNAIIGYSEMLIETLSDDDRSEIAADLKKIHFAGKHLLEVINAVLDISKIEAGKMEVFHQVFPIDEVVQNVIEISQPLVMKQHNKLVIEKGDDLGLIESDRMKLRQCLFNLVSNAAKFTERGVITLSVTREWHGDQEWVLFAVRDTGIGMKPEEVARIFDAFAQADAQVASKYGGSGLGLTITARFCELLGGSVTAESTYGEGTTFTIRLPALQPAMRPAEEPHGDAEPGDPPAGGYAATVLIVDDDPSVQELVRRALSRQDIQVLVARTGEQGLALARRYRPQAIILDVIMQRMDGWHVLARLKVDPDLRSIPVIMLSITDNRSAGFAMGATDYLVKPVELDRLAAILSKYCPAPAPPGVLAQSVGGRGGEP